MEALASAWQKYLQQGRVAIPRCENCEAWNWYPLPVCIHCGGNHISWQSVPMRGTVFSATRVHRNFTGIDIGKVPYVVALIEPEGAAGVRLTCRFVDQDGPVPAIGSKVTIVIAEAAEGHYLAFR